MSPSSLFRTTAARRSTKKNLRSYHSCASKPKYRLFSTIFDILSYLRILYLGATVKKLAVRKTQSYLMAIVKWGDIRSLIRRMQKQTKTSATIKLRWAIPGARTFSSRTHNSRGRCNTLSLCTTEIFFRDMKGLVARNIF